MYSFQYACSTVDRQLKGEDTKYVPLAWLLIHQASYCWSSGWFIVDVQTILALSSRIGCPNGCNSAGTSSEFLTAWRHTGCTNQCVWHVQPQNIYTNFKGLIIWPVQQTPSWYTQLSFVVGTTWSWVHGTSPQNWCGQGWESIQWQIENDITVHIWCVHRPLHSHRCTVFTQVHTKIGSLHTQNLSSYLSRLMIYLKPSNVLSSRYSSQALTTLTNTKLFTSFFLFFARKLTKNKI